VARVSAVCASPSRGTAKRPLPVVNLLPGTGVEGDGHAGPGARQVSILSDMSLARMEQAGVTTSHGCCGENIDISGEMELHSLLPGVRIRLGGEAVVETTGVGKDNSDGHAYDVIAGNIFPVEGLFARVLEGGAVSPGDPVEILRHPGFSVGVLTVSDSTSSGEREDLSGPAVIELLSARGYLASRYGVVPDEESMISERLRCWCEDGSLDLLLTTGGTGFSPRDVTPEATAAVVDRPVPGIPEMVRSLSARTVPTAWLSRATAGIRMGTLVVNLPGSRKAALECAGFTLDVAEHALDVLRGDVHRCGG